jgi:hypothetical protein
MIINKTIELWQQMLTSGKTELLDEILADDVVFHSPVIHTPQEGKKLTSMYLKAAFHVLLNKDFKYINQILQDNKAALEFTTVIEGISINVMDIIICDEQGKIIDFKVMIRPMQALQKVQQKMLQMLEK